MEGKQGGGTNRRENKEVSLATRCYSPLNSDCFSTQIYSRGILWEALGQMNLTALHQGVERKSGVTCFFKSVPREKIEEAG